MTPTEDDRKKACELFRKLIAVPMYCNSAEDNRLVEQTRIIAQALAEARQQGYVDGQRAKDELWRKRFAENKCCEESRRQERDEMREKAAEIASRVLIVTIDGVEPSAVQIRDRIANAIRKL